MASCVAFDGAGSGGEVTGSARTSRVALHDHYDYSDEEDAGGDGAALRSSNQACSSSAIAAHHAHHPHAVFATVSQS